MSFLYVGGCNNLPTGLTINVAFQEEVGAQIDETYRDLVLAEQGTTGNYSRRIADVPASYMGWLAWLYTGTLGAGMFTDFSTVTLIGGADVVSPVVGDVQAVNGNISAAEQLAIAAKIVGGTQAFGQITFLTTPVPSGIIIDFGGQFTAESGVDFTAGGSVQDAAASCVEYLNGLPEFSAIATASQNNDAVQIAGRAYAAVNLALSANTSDVILFGITGGVDPDSIGFLAAGNIGYLPVALATSSQLIGSVQYIRDVTNITDTMALEATSQELITRTGPFEGSGFNNIYGYLSAAMIRDATAPAELANSGYDPATMSLQAIQLTESEILAGVGNVPTAQQIADTTSELLASLHGTGSWQASAVTGSLTLAAIATAVADKDVSGYTQSGLLGTAMRRILKLVQAKIGR